MGGLLSSLSAFTESQHDERSLGGMEVLAAIKANADLVIDELGPLTGVDLGLDDAGRKAVRRRRADTRALVLAGRLRRRIGADG